MATFRIRDLIVSVAPLCAYSDPHFRFAVAGCAYSDPERLAPIGCMSAHELTSLKRQLAEAIEELKKRRAELQRAGPSPGKSEA